MATTAVDHARATPASRQSNTVFAEVLFLKVWYLFFDESLAPGNHVLDLATGTGENALLLAENIGAGSSTGRVLGMGGRGTPP
jgi:ubiquinone/menaquinone biosynthesis C-methylase UbiE